MPVYDDLSFRLSQLRANGEYSSEYALMGGNRFKISDLALATNTLAARSDFSTAHFSGSGNCQACHNNIKDDTGKDVSIITAWEPTMMANSARDPFLRKAQVKNEFNRTPSQSAVDQ